jgi:hypothetical protein
MSFGKSGGTNVTTPQLTPEQRQQIQAQNEFFTGTIYPTYQRAVTGASDLYEGSKGGVMNAAQNLSGTARQTSQSLGETGESALRTGIAGLEKLFGPEYEQQQLAAALAPAQQQYQQNLANQAAQFGGAGNLGSARSAIAQQALAGQTQSQQQMAAAQVLKDIAGQRAGVGSTLAQLGQGGLTSGLSAQGQAVTASMVPQDLYNKYASVIFATPQSTYGLGPTGTSTSTSQIGGGFSFK